MSIFQLRIRMLLHGKLDDYGKRKVHLLQIFDRRANINKLMC